MASFIPEFSTANLSLHAIPVAWILCMAPRMYTIFMYRHQTSKELDTRNPPKFKSTIADEAGLTTQSRGRLLRAEAAMANGFENLGLFAAAVVAGNMGGLRADWLNALSWGYVGCRVVYNYVYVNTETKAWVPFRTLSWFAGVVCCMTLFVQAGNRLKDGFVL